MRRTTIAALLTFALALVLGYACDSRAGTSDFGGDILVTTTPPRKLVAKIAVLGDPQCYGRGYDALGYGSTQANADTYNAAAAQRMREQIDDVIAWKPDFVIVAGDMANDEGGADQNGAARIADDPNHLFYGPDGDHQSRFFRVNGYDRLIAAGIPVFVELGNHDSCQELKKFYPPAEFLAYSWGQAVLTRAGICGNTSGTGTMDDTSHRRALFQTPIGSICVVGMPTNSLDWDAADNGWLETNTGCGASRPTFQVTHLAGANTSNAATFEAKGLIIGQVHGHYLSISTGGFNEVVSVQFAISGGGVNMMEYYVNYQDVGDGYATIPLSTGESWWTSIVIDPIADTSTIQAHNPHLGNRGDMPAGTTFKTLNSVTTLPYDFCASFGGPACP